MVVNSLAIQKGLEPLGFFAFTKLGLVMAVLGGLLTAFLGKRVLPERVSEEADSKSYFIEAKVKPDSPLVGKSISDNGLRHLGGLYLAEVVRGEHLITPVTPGEILEADDVLVFSGNIQSVHLLKGFQGLTVFNESSQRLTNNLVEVFISHQSMLVGKTIRDASFRTQFDAAVVAIRRGSERLGGCLGDIRLHAGDNLILAAGDDFHQHKNLERNFYLVNGLKSERFLSTRESLFVISGFLVALVCSVAGFVPLAEALFFLLGGLLLSGILTLEEIRRRFPFELLAIVTATLGIAQVIVSSGAATIIADAVLAIFGSWA